MGENEAQRASHGERACLVYGQFPICLRGPARYSQGGARLLPMRPPWQRGLHRKQRSCRAIRGGITRGPRPRRLRSAFRVSRFAGPKEAPLRSDLCAPLGRQSLRSRVGKPTGGLTCSWLPNREDWRGLVTGPSFRRRGRGPAGPPRRLPLAVNGKRTVIATAIKLEMRRNRDSVKS